MTTENVKASLMKGITAQFTLGKHVIEYWGSAYTGKETLKVDGELIKEARSFKTSSCHEFDIGGKACKLDVIVKPFRKSTAVISLMCDGVLEQSYQLKYGTIRKVAWYFKAIQLMAFFALGWMFMSDVISVMELIILAGIILTVSELFFKQHGWTIEEQNPCN
ncbi:hypothetical protein [Pseudoalteromonas lipolytica]